MGHRVAVVGASGYAGGELVRLIDGHPDLEIAALVASSSAGKTLSEVHPHLRDGDRVLEPFDADGLADNDLVFLALPHGASAEPAMALLERGVKVVDLGSDFRLDGPHRYEEAYGSEHPYPEQLGAWPYGLPEFFRDVIAASDRVAVPGCYPTSVALGLGPLVQSGAVATTGIVVTSTSGVTGAGRSLSTNLLYGAIDESVRPYGLVNHRHRPEMEQTLGAIAGTDAGVVFTPQLVPMQRGLVSLCHAQLTGNADPADILRAAYAESLFVDVLDDPPQSRWVVGSNRVLVSAHVAGATAIVVSALDNLVKGASGQAVQCANLMLGLEEGSGLPLEGWLP